MTHAIGSFVADLPPGRIVFGTGALDRVAQEVERIGVSSLLLIAGGSAAIAGGRTEAILGTRVAATHREIRQHVPQDVADAALRTARAALVDGVVTVGGGSSIGLGKVVAVEMEIPQIAVPTTYSGSEMTPVYGITGEQKVTRRDARALPKAVIYDPALTTDLPAGVTAASGLNALAHCMEAIVGRGATPPSVLVAREAASILPDALRASIRDGNDRQARSFAQYGGFLAGRALALAGTGLQHRLAHILGGRFGVVHAGVHAVLLPRVAALHEREMPDAMSTLAEALGAQESASVALYGLAADIGAPLTLGDIGLPHEAIDVVVEDLGDGYDAPAIRALLEDAFVPMMVLPTEGGAS